MSFANITADAAIAAAVQADRESRLPPVIYGEKVYLANELQDIVDWGLKLHDIPEMHKITQGEGIKIAILDTGRPDHFDCPEPLFSFNFTRYASDIDANGHSTHCAGTLAGRANGRGVIGVAPAVQVGYCKVLGDDGSGSNVSIVRGIDAAIAQGVDLISMSLGGGYDQAIEAACLRAVKAGIFLICAAGNDGDQGNNDTVGWPAKLGDTIAVASYNETGLISRFSSRGPDIDVAFPGEEILSCWPGNKYRRLSGTSMATPFAAGVVALMLSYQRKLAANGKIVTPVVTAEDLHQRFVRYAKDQGPEGRDRAWGFGIPDVDQFIRGGVLEIPNGEISKDVFALGSLRIRFPADVVAGKAGGIFWFE
jgi:subtilisin family serine protease